MHTLHIIALMHNMCAVHDSLLAGLAHRADPITAEADRDPMATDSTRLRSATAGLVVDARCWERPRSSERFLAEELSRRGRSTTQRQIMRLEGSSLGRCDPRPAVGCGAPARHRAAGDRRSHRDRHAVDPDLRSSASAFGRLRGCAGVWLERRRRRSTLCAPPGTEQRTGKPRERLRRRGDGPASRRPGVRAGRAAGSSRRRGASRPRSRRSRGGADGRSRGWRMERTS